MKIKEVLGLEVGTKLKCIEGYKDIFIQGNEYPVDDFSPEGTPWIRGDACTIPFFGDRVTSGGYLCVNFGNGEAVFKVINESDSKIVEDNKQVLSSDCAIGELLTCTESDVRHFTVGDDYEVEVLSFNKLGLVEVSVRDDDGELMDLDADSDTEFSKYLGKSVKFVKTSSLPLRGSSLTKKLLKRRDVLAMVGDDGDENTTPADIRLVNEFEDGQFVTYCGMTFNNAVAVNNKGEILEDVDEKN